MINVSWNTSIKVARSSEPTANPMFVGWRWLHGVEGGRMPPPGMPEIVPPIDVVRLEMNEAIQRLSYLLMTRLNPLITGALWRKLHSYDRAMTNKEQNGYDGGTAHADFINRYDMSASLPAYDKMQRGFGGSFFCGMDLGDRIRCDPGVHGIDARTVTMANVEQKVDEAFDNNWYVHAVSIGDPDYSNISYFPQGKGLVVVYPFIFDRPITFWKNYQGRQYLESWNADELPDPLKIYRSTTL